MMKIVILAVIVFLVSSCSQCKEVSYVEEQYQMADEMYSDIEFYYIDVPFYENQSKVIEERSQLQELDAEACGDLLRIKNPTSKSVTILLKADDSGYFKVHALSMMMDTMGRSSEYAIVYHANRDESMLSPLSKIVIPSYGNLDLRLMSSPNDDSILCLDSVGFPCASYEECDISIGNNIFDIDSILDEDITISNPLYARTNKSVTETVKNYRKVMRNRTVIKAKSVLVPVNVTVTKRVCD